MSPARPRSSTSAAFTWSSIISAGRTGRKVSAVMVGTPLRSALSDNLGGRLFGVLECHEGAVAPALDRIGAVGAEMPAAALLTAIGGGRDELCRGHHIGKADAGVLALQPCDVADEVFQSIACADDAGLRRHAPAQFG